MFGDLAQPGRRIAVRVTPGARRNAVTRDGDVVRVHVTVAPEAGKANQAVRKLLAKAIGIAPSRLDLERGARGRDKVFRVVE